MLAAIEQFLNLGAADTHRAGIVDAIGRCPQETEGAHWYDNVVEPGWATPVDGAGNHPFPKSQNDPFGELHGNGFPN